MDAEDRKLSFPRIAGLTIDFLVIVVPIALTVLVASAITAALLPEVFLAVLGAAGILGVVRGLNYRHDEWRKKRYSQVPH